MLTVKARLVKELKPYPRNPRVIDDASYRGLKASVQRFGLVEPLVINPRDEVVSGNQRLKVVQDLEFEKVPTVLVDLPIHEELALNIALNNPATAGKYTPMVQDLIEEIREVDLSLPDSLRFDNILSEDVEIAEDDLKVDGTEERIPEMDLLPYEHYDYVVILCRDTYSWKMLTEKLGIKEVRSKDRIGLGRAITFEKFKAKVGWK